MLESHSKLMYYPTDVYEIYRMLGIVGRIDITMDDRDELEKLIGEDIYFNLLEKSINENTGITNTLYDYLLKNKRYDLIKKYFTIAFGYSHSNTSTIFDPFAGEAVWLEMFKNAIPIDDVNSNKLHLIANELETNRYEQIVDKGIVDEHYNKSFEELSDIPKKSISLLLYNPPYGDTNGKRNVLHYLEMLVHEDLLHKSKTNYDNGKIIMVVRKDDLLDSLSFIVKYFDVKTDLIYKVNEEEYNRYKQFVVYASIRSNPLNDKKINEAMLIQEEVSKIQSIVNSDPKFDISMFPYFGGNSMNIPAVPYERLKENHKALEKGEFYISGSSNDNWKWLKEFTEIKENETIKIDKPTPLKVGEIANIIASGMINGEMQLDNQGTGFHIVAGGIKEQLQQEIVQEQNRKGELENKTKTILSTQPYLNILVNDGGKVKIKELQGGTELE